jgi:CHRD domain
MKQLGILLACLVVLAVPSLARAERIKASLIGYEEVPAVSTVASGEFDGRISEDDQSIDYELTYSGLQGTVTQAHIHVAQRGVNGSIVIWLCGTDTNPGPAGTPPCPESGTVSGTVTAANVVAGSTASQQLDAGELDEVIAAIRAGVAYANVHTSPLSTGGEIRGQIRSSKRDRPPFGLSR